MLEGFRVIAVTSLPIAGVVALVGVLVNFLIIGPTWSPEAMKFEFKKLDPVQGIKNKFKLKTFVELLKSIFKISVAVWLIYGVAKKHVPDMIHTAALPVEVTLEIYKQFLKEVVIRIGIFFIFVAVADLIFQKMQFAKDMKMEKHEVKQEYKDSEGDPQIKGKRRQIAQEIAYDEGPRAVKKAKAVITNPEHLAIAIAYDPEKFPAPYIVVMGRGSKAEQIIKFAEQYDVPVMRNVELAHLLWAKGSVNQYIPEASYDGIAEILQWVSELEGHSGGGGAS